MWIGIGALTGPWHNVTIYSTPWAWIPAAPPADYNWTANLDTLNAGQPDAFIEITLPTFTIAVVKAYGTGGYTTPFFHTHSFRTGIRARVRHPVYLGHLCEMLAWSLGTGLLVCWLLTAFAIVTGAVMIRMEDAELEKRFGPEFMAYRREVPAILPIVRLG